MVLIDKVTSIFSLGKHTPRWIIFAIDLAVCLLSVVLAYLLRFNFDVPKNELAGLIYVVPLVIFVRATSFVISRTHAGIIRYTTTKDAERIFLVIMGGSLVFVLTNIVLFFIKDKFLVPFSIVIIDFLITVLFMTFFRMMVKTFYLEYSHPKQNKTNVIIFGIGEFGIITKRTLDRDAGTNFKVVAFIDSSIRNVGQKLEGVNIYHVDSLEQLLEKNEISNLIISHENIRSKLKNTIIDTCLNQKVKVLTVPPVHNWINGELSFNQIKKVKIEDLLERAPIILDDKKIKKELLGKCVLVTGAAGSIGSEIVRQLMLFNPAKIVLLDNAESPLYDFELELLENYRAKHAEVVIGDVTDPVRMRKVFETFHPDVIYHAAAYKHVPMMENNPVEAIRTNLMGTKMVADLACEFNTKKFVMISTDKAVNPTNIMGASKRLAEIYIQSLNKKSNPSFVTTRFGNVLGSNGSVIPRFKKQIESGGPVTVTHPEITRYFMTIPEACQLVLEAGAMGEGGEVYIFDMGDSVKIVDLAKKMIKLSGLEIGKDIQLNFTGLRPGEKLYEELLFDKENNIPTHNGQIMIAKVMQYEYDDIVEKINSLIELRGTHDNMRIVKLMKDIVPEFKSKNSIYEVLDNGKGKAESEKQKHENQRTLKPE